MTEQTMRPDVLLAEIERLRAENKRLQRHATSMINEMNAGIERAMTVNATLLAALKVAYSFVAETGSTATVNQIDAAIKAAEGVKSDAPLSVAVAEIRAAIKATEGR